MTTPLCVVHDALIEAVLKRDFLETALSLLEADPNTPNCSGPERLPWCPPRLEAAARERFPFGAYDPHDHRGTWQPSIGLRDDYSDENYLSLPALLHQLGTVECGECEGSGIFTGWGDSLVGRTTIPCEPCNGTGRLGIVCAGHLELVTATKCLRCSGTGNYDDRDSTDDRLCPKCDGHGEQPPRLDLIPLTESQLADADSFGLSVEAT